MDNQYFDIGKIREAAGLPLLASNQPSPMEPQEPMPIPLMRGPMPDQPPGPGLINDQPAPPPMRAPAGQAPMPMGGGPNVQDDTSLGSPPAPDKPSNPLEGLMVTKEDLQNAADKKKQIAMIGALTNGMSNQQSFGNFFLGHMNPKNDSSAYFKQMEGFADAPVEQKRALLAQKLKEPEMQFAMKSSDPSSTESNLMSSMMKANIQNNAQLTPDQKTGMLQNIQGKSATELNKLAGSPLFADMMANDKLFQTLNNKVAIAEAKAEAMRNLATDKAARVSPKDQMKTLKETQNAMEQMRGDPSTQQAEKDIYAADKADTLMNMYGDPNKLSRPQVQLVVGEVGKIAQGGSPTIHELEGLNPNTFRGNVASAWGKVVNDPQPANLAAFVKQYQDYANGVTKDAENHVLDRYSRIIDPRRDYLSPADQERLDAKYTHRFDEARKKREQKSGGEKMTAEDAAAFQHIKDQPNDPNSGAIASVLKKKYPSLVK